MPQQISPGRDQIAFITAVLTATLFTGIVISSSNHITCIVQLPKPTNSNLTTALGRASGPSLHPSTTPLQTRARLLLLFSQSESTTHTRTKVPQNHLPPYPLTTQPHHLCPILFSTNTLPYLRLTVSATLCTTVTSCTLNQKSKQAKLRWLQVLTGCTAYREANCSVSTRKADIQVLGSGHSYVTPQLVPKCLGFFLIVCLGFFCLVFK